MKAGESVAQPGFIFGGGGFTRKSTIGENSGTDIAQSRIST